MSVCILGESHAGLSPGVGSTSLTTGVATPQQQKAEEQHALQNPMQTHKMFGYTNNQCKINGTQHYGTCVIFPCNTPLKCPSSHDFSWGEAGGSEKHESLSLAPKSGAKDSDTLSVWDWTSCLAVVVVVVVVQLFATTHKGAP